MKQWKLSVLVCALVACLCFALAGCQQQEYKPASKDQAVSSSALGKNGTLRVGVNANSAPLAGQTSSSARIVGIDVDVAAYIADQLGLKLEVTDIGTEPEKALANGTVDMVLGVESDSDASFWKSTTYLETGVSLFGTASESSIPTTDSKPKIAAQASSKSSWRVSNLFGDDALVSKNDLKSAFDDLASGSVRYVAADAVIGSYVANSTSKDKNTAKIVALLQDPSGYCAAVSSNNTELQGAVASVMSKLVGGGVIDIIESKWLGTAIDLDNVTVVKASGSDSSKTEKSEGEKSAASASSEAKSSESAAKTDENATASQGSAQATEGQATQSQSEGAAQSSEGQASQGSAQAQGEGGTA